MIEELKSLRLQYEKIIFRLYDEMHRNHIPSKILEYEILRSDGEVCDYEASVSLIRDDTGKTIGYRGIGHDITERRKMESDLARYRDFMESVEDSYADSICAAGVHSAMRRRTG